MRDLILFAMSTLRREYKEIDNERLLVRLNNLSENIYYPPDGAEPISYTGQMEPIVKWLMKSSADSSFDLVILCSKDSYQKYYSDDDQVTALQFFIRKICDSMDTFVLEDVMLDPEDSFKTAESEDKRIRFVMVPLDLDEPMKAVQTTVEYIREWHKNNENPEEMPGKMYLDIHGGLRDMELIQNAITSLLKIDGIIPDGVYTGYFDGREFKHKDASHAYGMFDFVSAMNEFINYGHAKSLKKYLNIKGRSEQERDVSAAMENVSLGLEMCDPDTYRQGLNSLRRALDNLGDTAPSEFTIFRDYIRDSFGELLDSKTRKTLLIVKRCVEKELIQQALTFIESAMPYEIVSKQLIYYADSSENKSILTDIKPPYILDNEHYFFDTILAKSIHYFNWRYANEIISGITRRSVDDDTKKNIEKNRLTKVAVSDFMNNKDKFLNVLRTKKAFKETKIQYSLFDKSIDLPKDLVIKIKSDASEMVLTGIDSKLCETDRIMLGYFLRMHKALKECRNMFNHGSSDRPKMEQIRSLLELYIAYAEVLYDIA